MDQFKALLVALPALFVLAVKAGLAIGATGTAIEGVGDFLTAKFSNAKIKRFGAFLTAFGRKLEAIGTDIPKFVEDVRKWYAVIAKMLGLALVFCLVMTALQACTSVGTPCSPTDTVMIAKAAECRARVKAECVGVPDNECPVVAECDAWGEARCGFGAGGSGGSAGAQ